MCPTKKARDQFLKNARRWCKNARKDAHGTSIGVSMAVDMGAANFADPRQGATAGQGGPGNEYFACAVF